MGRLKDFFASALSKEEGDSDKRDHDYPGSAAVSRLHKTDHRTPSPEPIPKLTITSRRNRQTGIYITILILLALLLNSPITTNHHPPPPSLIPHPIGPPNPLNPNSSGSSTYPRAIRLPNGPLLSIHTTQQGNEHILTLTHTLSPDHPWHSLGHITQRPLPTSDLDNPTLLHLNPSPHLLAAFRNHDRAASGTGYTHYRITLCHSPDGGRTWRYRATVAERPASSPAGFEGLWEPVLRRAGDGRVQCFFADERGRAQQRVVMRWSGDGGRTWGEMVRVSPGGWGRREGMVGLAEGMGEGEVFAVFEDPTPQSGWGIWATRSHDDGFTWEPERTPVYIPSPGKKTGAPQVCNVGGRLVVSFMTNEDSGGNEIDGGDMKVVVSPDGGRTWKGPFVTAPAPAHWPGLLALDERHFMALYARDGEGAVSRVFVLG